MQPQSLQTLGVLRFDPAGSGPGLEVVRAGSQARFFAVRFFARAAARRAPWALRSSGVFFSHPCRDTSPMISERSFFEVFFHLRRARSAAALSVI